MRIEIDTENLDIIEHPQEGDAELSSTELEEDIAHGIAALMAGQAIKHYKSENARYGYLLMLVNLAYKAVQAAYEEGEDEWGD